MTGDRISRFNVMPGEQLAADVHTYAMKIAGSDSYGVHLRSAGYLLRNYVGLFNAGPLWDNVVEQLPEKSQDALEKVADACLRTLIVSSSVDQYPIGIRELKEFEGGDGEVVHDIYDVLELTQLGLEMAEDMPADLRRMTIENELKILTGEIDPNTTPIRRMTGPSLITREGVRETVLTAGEQFGAFFGGCEFLLTDDRQRDGIMQYVANNVGSQWQHPNWVEPTDSGTW